VRAGRAKWVCVRAARWICGSLLEEKLACSLGGDWQTYAQVCVRLGFILFWLSLHHLLDGMWKLICTPAKYTCGDTKS
jgi:hypothetical protein